MRQAMTVERATRRRRRVAAVIVGCLVGLAAVEVGLQAVAYWLWSTRDTASTAGGDGRVVLAVGDSFTFGLGASDRAASYPAVLGELLRARDGTDASVVNAGVPGNRTVDVAARLDHLLQLHAPDDVLLLVGYNDVARDTERLDPSVFDDEALAPAFPWKLRTLELVRRVADALADDALAVVTVDDLVGSWSDGALRIRFERDGSCVVNDVGTRFRIEAGRLVIGDGDGELRYDARIVDGGLLLAPERPGEPGLSLARVADEAAAPALRGIERVAAEGPFDAAAALAACAELDTEDPPRESDRWWRLIATGYVGIEVERVIATLERGIDRLPDHDPWRAGLLRGLAFVTLDTAPEDALRHLVAAAAIDGRLDGIGAHLERSFPGRELEVFDALLATLALPAATEARIRSGLGQRLVDGDSLTATIAANLELLVERCRAAGATPWLVGYPEVHPAVREAVRRAVDATGVTWIDVAAAFRARLAAEPGVELFVEDRHCNDRGYRLLAETVAAAIDR